MQDTIRHLLITHLIVLILCGLVFLGLVGWHGAYSSVAGFLSFSLAVVASSRLVLKASQGVSGRFWGSFILAEIVKWFVAGSLLSVAFITKFFQPVPLILGFFLSVLVQVFFPIVVTLKSRSES